MKSLEECRKEINEIDGALVELLVRRMYVSGDVARYKKANDLPVYDEKREEQLLARIGALAGPEYGDAVLQVYETILTESKKKQMNMME